LLDGTACFSKKFHWQPLHTEEVLIFLTRCSLPNIFKKKKKKKKKKRKELGFEPQVKKRAPWSPQNSATVK